MRELPPRLQSHPKAMARSWKVSASRRSPEEAIRAKGPIGVVDDGHAPVITSIFPISEHAGIVDQQTTLFTFAKVRCIHSKTIVKIPPRLKPSRIVTLVIFQGQACVILGCIQDSSRYVLAGGSLVAHVTPIHWNFSWVHLGKVVVSCEGLIPTLTHQMVLQGGFPIVTSSVSWIFPRSTTQQGIDCVQTWRNLKWINCKMIAQDFFNQDLQDGTGDVCGTPWSKHNTHWIWFPRARREILTKLRCQAIGQAGGKRHPCWACYAGKQEN